MTIRELTDDEKDRLLSQEEVNQLEDGDEVMIKWSGGNGPHRYELEFRNSVDYPFVDGASLATVTGDPDSPLNKVFLPEGEL